MIPVPNMRLAALAPAFNVDHAIFNDCTGGKHPRSAAPTGGGAGHTPDRGPEGNVSAPAAESQSVSGRSSSAVERGGPDAHRPRAPRRGFALAATAPGDVTPGPGARLAQPLPTPSLLHILTWLRYHARRRP